MEHISLKDARRIALLSQGFGSRPKSAPTPAAIRKTIDKVSLLQIDSVNVLVRSHFLPIFSRLGPYPRDLIDKLAYRKRELFEYWGHEASFIPIALHPFVRYRMLNPHPRWQEWAKQNKKFVEQVYREVSANGPTSVGQLSNPGERNGPWWGWRIGKAALEWLFVSGRVSVAHRKNFERYYDLTERVLPEKILNEPTPTDEETRRHLIDLAARALGVGTAVDLMDYFRLNRPKTRPILSAMVSDGLLDQVQVEGWREKSYLHPKAPPPRPVESHALLTPFDSLIWERKRTERLFEFHYRIEIYVPEGKRQFGYYVLPFLMNEALVARVDLKSDRKSDTLLVKGAFSEPGIKKGEVGGALATSLQKMSSWLGLQTVQVEKRGDLASTLQPSLR